MYLFETGSGLSLRVDLPCRGVSIAKGKIGKAQIMNRTIIKTGNGVERTHCKYNLRYSIRCIN